MTGVPFASVEELQAGLRARAYLADVPLTMALYLALTLDKPLLLEGEAGVGKTEVAKVAAQALGRRLIRLQCYEGIDTNQALYEWAYARQLFALRALPPGDTEAVRDLFTPEFLVERPLLAALRAGAGAVLLIDELDRADDEFEAFLLEILSDFTVTIPEIGTIACEQPPAVIITSNRTRELHDALKRRCLYHWIPFPEAERERAIIRAQVPGISEQAAQALVESINAARDLPLLKRPGIAESIEWSRAAQLLAGGGDPWPSALRRSLGLLVKEEEDLLTMQRHADEIFRAVTG